MHDLAVLFLHLLATVARLAGPGGARSVVAESVLVAQQIALAVGIPINKDVVRRILAVRYQPEPDSAGPSWLTALGHAKDSLWSLDLFRCESTVLRTHWVLR
jgi:hypothetical protein